MAGILANPSNRHGPSLPSPSFPSVLRWHSPCTGVSTPPSPEIPEKSQKGLPGPPGPKCQKSVEKVPEHRFCSPFRVIWDFLDTFLTPRAPGNTFLRLFGDFGPREAPIATSVTTLSFLSLFFLEKGKENPPKKTRIFYSHRTAKIPGKEGKTLKKTRIPCRGKNKEFQKKQGKCVGT